MSPHFEKLISPDYILRRLFRRTIFSKVGGVHQISIKFESQGLLPAQYSPLLLIIITSQFSLIKMMYIVLQLYMTVYVSFIVSALTFKMYIYVKPTA